ncbi:hypothetical protein ACFVRD_13665 [Streptomyces sp. NPDC057908]|uniref:hypothetical protein n=1 Tax=Streptomyces sp. NPDC057908 TaxID=3346276 RepID=UPI0036ED8F47
MSHHAPEKSATVDAAYRTLIGHTVACATCRAGDACPTEARLDRKWKAARR